MQSYVNSGDMAPLTLFYNGPAHWNFTNLMSSYYGTGYTPSFFCDGVWENIGWNQTLCENAINARLAEPAVLDISVSIGGDETSGVVYYNITAEEDLQAGGMVRLISVLFENDILANSSWGVYNGKTLNWIPRMSPIGVTGVSLDFTGPYPQTVTAMGEYTIDPGWDFENMGIITYVFDYSSKEIFNADYEEDLNSIMGIESGAEALSMTVGPNPSSGQFSALCSAPGGGQGTVEVFDLSGRTVASAPSSSADFSVDRSGLYLVRFTSSQGESITRSVAVTR
jgi:hypothetical protein